MITFSKLGKHGNLGNQLFQIASLIGLSKTFGHEVAIPEWQYKNYFEGLPIIQNIQGKQIEEKHFNYDLEQFSQLSKDGNFDILGWLQSEKYWKDATIFKLKDCKKLEQPTIAISVRRGDYVDNSNYVLLQINYYLNALLKFNLSDFKVIVFSDDIDYCKIHFSCLDNVVFANGNAIEQLTLMSKCHAFVIANSTFSWWGAYLGNGTTIRPDCLFNGELLRTSNSNDFYPETWLVQVHKEKIDLSDVTFIIPVKYDHPHREENLLLNILHLQKYFNTNIIVGEIGNHFKWLGNHVNYVNFDLSKFHRTKMLNEMTLLTDTPYIINWDADIFISPVQIWQAVDMLRSGTDFVYPYDGRFARVPRTERKTIAKYLDVGMLKSNYSGMNKGDMVSVGGAIAYNKQSFINAGGENENFVSYGAEDLERYYRFKTLGYKVERIKGALYHLDHAITIDSSNKHEDFEANKKEYDKVSRMNKQELELYTYTWQSITTDKKIESKNLLPLNIKINSTMKITLDKKFYGQTAVFHGLNIKLDANTPQHHLEILADKMPHLVSVDYDVEVKKKHEPLNVPIQQPTTLTLTEQPKDETTLSEALPKQQSKPRGRKPKMAK
jgi:hypothetical protein